MTTVSAINDGLVINETGVKLTYGQLNAIAKAYGAAPVDVNDVNPEDVSDILQRAGIVRADTQVVTLH